MHDDAGNVGEAMGVGDQLIVAGEEAAIDEIVALDAGEGERVVILRKRRTRSASGKSDKVLPSHALQARAASICTSASGLVRRR